MIIKFRHFIRILKEIILQKHEFILSDSFPLISINLPPRPEPIGPITMPSPYRITHLAQP